MPHDLQRRHVVARTHALRAASRSAPSSWERRTSTPGGDDRSAASVRSRVELAAEDHVIAREQPGDRPHERAVVVQRARASSACRPASSSAAASRLGIDQRGRGVQDQLRAAGAAAGSHALPRIRHGVEARVAARRGGAGSGDQPGGRQLDAGVLGRIDADDQRRRRQLDDPVELALREARRHGRRRRADLPRRRSSRRGTRRSSAARAPRCRPARHPAPRRPRPCRSRAARARRG